MNMKHMLRKVQRWSVILLIITLLLPSIGGESFSVEATELLEEVNTVEATELLEEVNTVEATELLEGIKTVEELEVSEDIQKVGVLEISEDIEEIESGSEIIDLPIISDVTITGTNNGNVDDLWYNGNDELWFTVSATSENSEIKGVFAITEEMADLESAGIPMATAENHLVEGMITDEGTWIIPIIDADFNSRTYYFYAYNEVGNIAEYEETKTIKRDSQMPNTDNILISFNGIDIDSVSYEQNNIIDKFTGYIKNIFVKTTVDVTLYIPDTIVYDNGRAVVSEVQSVSFAYNGEMYINENPTSGVNAYLNSEGNFESTGDEGVPYQIFMFTLPINIADTECSISDKITITSVKDCAGNWCGCEEELSIVGNHFIVIDNAVPVLTKFEVSANSTNIDDALMQDNLDNNLYYAKNIVGDDIKIEVGIEDDIYFNVENVMMEYGAISEQNSSIETWTRVEKAPTWTSDEADPVNHTVIYTFDGKIYGEVTDTFAGEETYVFRVSYEDLAGNEMVLDENVIGVSEEDDITDDNMSKFFRGDKQIIIDHKAPELTSMTFHTPKAIYNGDTSVEVNGTKSTTVTDANSRLYYDTAITADFIISDGYFNSDDCVVAVQERSDRTAIWENSTASSIITPTTSSDGAFNVSMNDADAEYTFTVTYTDRAGNVMVAATTPIMNCNEVYAGSVDSVGSYQAPIMIQDTVAPTVEATYIVNEGESISLEELTVDYTAEKVEVAIVITEKNMELANTMVTVMATNINGNTEGITQTEATKYTKSLSDLIKEGIAVIDSKGVIMTLTLESEAIYTVSVEIEDKVSKMATYNSEKVSFYIDHTPPIINIVTTNGAILSDDSDVIYTVINDGIFSNVMNKITFGYFAKEAIEVSITAHDLVSGVASISYIYTSVDDPSGKEGNATEKVMLVESDKSEGTISFVLPMSFKGNVTVYATDMANNISVLQEAPGVIGETQGKHEETALAKVEVTSEPTKTAEYYNEDVSITFTTKDGYSGLYDVSYLAGSDLEETKEYRDGEEIETDEVTRTHTILANNNNENNIETGLSFIDNAGYEEEVSEDELPIIHIDTTEPIITVEYDNNDVFNEKYYKEQRIATVSIQERNFDPNDTELMIDGPVVAISEWSHSRGSGCSGGDYMSTYHTDECIWSCTITYSEDGDYTFTCNTTDLAGNYTEYDEVHEFTIDQTLPEINVNYDNDDVSNEFYYNASRTATVQIEEHNFQANEVEITMTAADDGQPIAVPSVSSWSTNGDIHIAYINYDYDGEFTFDINCIDLAGNEAEDYTEELFVVDLTNPKVVISEIEHMSANNGVIAPNIEITDTNYDENGVKLMLVGCNNGELLFRNNRVTINKGQKIVFDDIPYVQENDDLYTLVASATDLAGNVCEQEVVFSVNRFGSVYILGDTIQELIEEYYANEEMELHVTEINVDTLEFQEITYSRDGNIVVLESKENYHVEESGTEVSWKSYEYTIFAENFAEEGNYIVTISSKDKATNQMNNKISGKDIAFMIDKTSPSVVITGVEHGVQYKESSRMLTIDVKDNILLDKVYAYINGKSDIREFTAEELYETNGILSIEIGDATDWQTVKVVSVDAAGNRVETEEIKFLITTNIFYQWYRNRVAFYSTLGMIAVVTGSSIYCFGIWKGKIWTDNLKGTSKI
ncbi:MAG: hypothetical protein R3Y24_09345 [Eubacteriales bacterium]